MVISRCLRVAAWQFTPSLLSAIAFIRLSVSRCQISLAFRPAFTYRLRPLVFGSLPTKYPHLGPAKACLLVAKAAYTRNTASSIASRDSSTTMNPRKQGRFRTSDIRLAVKGCAPLTAARRSRGQLASLHQATRQILEPQRRRR